jgi:hypothetical protein
MYLPRLRSGPRLGLLVGLVICCLFGLGVGSAAAQTVTITGEFADEFGFTNDSTPTITFQSTDISGPVFQCRIVSSEPIPGVPAEFPSPMGGPNCAPEPMCTPDFMFCNGSYTPASALPDGTYTFEVRDVETPADSMGRYPSDATTFTVDTMAPDTVILSGPSGLTNDSTPTFTFDSSQANSTFQCSRDGGTYTPCSSPYTLDPALGDGTHTFDVRAIDQADNVDPSPAHFAFTVDTVPPQTTIAGPSGTINDPTPTFTFNSNEPNSTFQCSRDGGAFTPCSSPFTPDPPLGDGPHTFDVYAIDAAGNSDPLPAHAAFTVETSAPETALSAPSGPTNDSTPTFTFSSNEPNSTFQCSRDGGPFTPCASPFTLDPPLGDGPHTFDVRAIDPAGNPDPSPAHAAFTLDTVPPQATIAGPSGTINDPTPTFTFSANEGTAGFECRIDDAPFTACASPFTPASALSDGPHIFEVRAIDLAGNRGPAASFPFTVRAGGPGGPGPPESRLPPPKVGRSVNLSVVRGRVRVRTPGSGSFVDLTQDTQVPVGSLIDTRRGTVRLTSARNAAGATRSAEFSLGVFRVLQSSGRRPSTDAVIEPPKCARTNSATRLRLKTITAAAAKARVIRDRSSAALGARRRKEEWRVKGKYSRAGSVATEWGTIERCDRTTTVVRKGRVRVFDRVRRRTVSVGPGQRYKAPARR